MAFRTAQQGARWNPNWREEAEAACLAWTEETARALARRRFGDRFDAQSAHFAGLVDLLVPIVLEHEDKTRAEIYVEAEDTFRWFATHVLMVRRARDEVDATRREMREFFDAWVATTTARLDREAELSARHEADAAAAREVLERASELEAVPTSPAGVVAAAPAPGDDGADGADGDVDAVAENDAPVAAERDETGLDVVADSGVASDRDIETTAFAPSQNEAEATTEATADVTTAATVDAVVEGGAADGAENAERVEREAELLAALRIEIEKSAGRLPALEAPCRLGVRTGAPVQVASPRRSYPPELPRHGIDHAQALPEVAHVAEPGVRPGIHLLREILQVPPVPAALAPGWPLVCAPHHSGPQGGTRSDLDHIPNSAEFAKIQHVVPSVISAGCEAHVALGLSLARASPAAPVPLLDRSARPPRSRWHGTGPPTPGARSPLRSARPPGGLARLPADAVRLPSGGARASPRRPIAHVLACDGADGGACVAVASDRARAARVVGRPPVADAAAGVDAVVADGARVGAHVGIGTSTDADAGAVAA